MKELNALRRCTMGEHKICQLKTSLTFILWFLAEHIISIVSAVGLCMMTWVELFSGELLTNEVGPLGGIVKTNVHILPLLVLLLPLPINCLLHSNYTNVQSAFSFAHGALSAVFPAR